MIVLERFGAGEAISRKHEVGDKTLHNIIRKIFLITDGSCLEGK